MAASRPVFSWERHCVKPVHVGCSFLVFLALFTLIVFSYSAIGQTVLTERVSVSTAAVQGNSDSLNPSISGDGRFVAFESRGTNLVANDTNGRRDIFVRHRQTGATERVSVSTAGIEGDGGSFNPSISDDGRFIAFESGATNLVAGDGNGRRDIFVHDRLTHVTERVEGKRGTGYFPLIKVSNLC